MGRGDGITGQGADNRACRLDLGRVRRLRPQQVVATRSAEAVRVTGNTPLSALSGRIVCSACRADGLPGATVTIQAAFVDERQRVRSEARMLNEREVPLEGSRRA